MKVSMIPNDVLTIRCSQNDTALRQWTFQLTENDRIYTPSGTVSLVCSNGVEVPITISGNDLICPCTAELSATSGTFNAKIKIVQNDEILYSQMMKLRVEVKP